MCYSSLLHSYKICLFTTRSKQLSTRCEQRRKTHLQSCKNNSFFSGYLSIAARQAGSAHRGFTQSDGQSGRAGGQCRSNSMFALFSEQISCCAEGEGKTSTAVSGSTAHVFFAADHSLGGRAAWQTAQCAACWSGSWHCARKERGGYTSH